LSFLSEEVNSVLPELIVREMGRETVLLGVFTAVKRASKQSKTVYLIPYRNSETRSLVFLPVRMLASPQHAAGFVFALITREEFCSSAFGRQPVMNS
jgi:hypothetical protein